MGIFVAYLEDTLAAKNEPEQQVAESVGYRILVWK